MTADPTKLDPGPASWAALLRGWGHLVALGVPRGQALRALSQEGPLPLRNLAGALALGADVAARERALEQAGLEVPGWLAPLLCAEALAPGLLAAAAWLSQERSVVWRPGRTWARLRALHAGGARPGDALGALAHDARHHGRKGLAEALNSAARRARQGEALATALAGASGYTHLERLAVDRLEAAGLDPVLEALEALSELQEGEGGAAAPVVTGEPPAREEDPLVRLAEAASAGKRGLERVLTGLGGMLGIDREAEREHAAQVARETVAKRSGPTEPTLTPTPSPAEPEPASPPAKGRRKTIGGDSGPVRLNELHAVDPAAPRDQETWLAALEEARARVTLLEVQPTEAGLGAEVGRELETLKREARGLGLEAEHLEALAALRTRWDAWRKHYGGA